MADRAALGVQDKKLAIFVSSTRTDVEEYRREAREAISRFNFIPLMMEHFPAQDRPQQEVITRFLADADAVILIAGPSHGTLTDETRSYVEWELGEAEQRDLPVIALVLEKQLRSSARNIKAVERQRQEAFIERLRKSARIVKSFTEKSFATELGAALKQLPSQLKPHAGYVKAREYQESFAKVRLVRAIANLILLRESCLEMTQGYGNEMEQRTDTRGSVQRILEMLNDETWADDVTIEFLSRMVTSLLNRLHGLSSEKGFAPESTEELRLLLDVLFGSGLRTLKATSIHSSHPDLVAYRGYWEDPDLGPFFQNKNQDFLNRQDRGRELRRIYVCDSIADSVAEAWFGRTVVDQVQMGAQVKVLELDEQKHGPASSYEDFGIYEHGVAADRAFSYLLLAPLDKNRTGDDLHTVLIPDQKTVATYAERFDSMWERQTETLTMETSTTLDEARRQRQKIHGEARINDLFDGRVILRSMRRLDTGTALLSEDSGFVRKYERQYAQALASHISSSWPRVRQVLYIGDTYRNDGTLIRNLQSLGLQVSGFICEPQLQLRRLWFNSILYSDEWSDLIAFGREAVSSVGQEVLAIFDIDQTLWAPKGVHEGPLSHTRTRAMTRLVDGYMHGPEENEVARRAKERIPGLYEEISKVKYHDSLTMDNEDYKAAICVFLALNIVAAPQELRGPVQRGVAFFTRVGDLSAADFASYIMDDYLPPIVSMEGSSGLANFNRFITQTLATVISDQYSNYGETNGISVPRVNDDVLAIIRAMSGPSTIKYEAFRVQEFEEAYQSATVDLPLKDSIVISKPAWDLAGWLKEKGAHLLALSDRPDEATALGEQSLLDTSMKVYGRAIEEHLFSLPS